MFHILQRCSPVVRCASHIPASQITEHLALIPRILPPRRLAPRTLPPPNQVNASINPDFSCPASAMWRGQIGFLWERLSQLVDLGLLFSAVARERRPGARTQCGVSVKCWNAESKLRNARNWLASKTTWPCPFRNLPLYVLQCMAIKCGKLYAERLHYV